MTAAAVVVAAATAVAAVTAAATAVAAARNGNPEDYIRKGSRVLRNNGDMDMKCRFSLDSCCPF